MDINEFKINQERKRRRSLTMKWISLTFGAIVLAFATNYLIIYIEIYSTGFSGISQGISYTLNDFLLPNPSELNKILIYWSIVFMGNIPVFIFSKRKFGSGFLKASSYVFLVMLGASLFFSSVPGFKDLQFFDKAELDAASDLIKFITYGFIGIIAGFLSGWAIGIVFKFGASSFGLDPIVKYYGRTKQLDVGTLILGIAILNAFSWTLLGGALNGDIKSFDDFLQIFVSPVIFASIIFYLTSSMVISKMYSSTKKSIIEINSSKTDEISYHLNSLNYHRNHTITKVIGGYSHKDRFILSTIVNNEELDDVLSLVYTIDVNAFIYTTEVKGIYGNFDNRPFTFEDKALAEKASNRKNKKRDLIEENEKDLVLDAKHNDEIKYKITSDGIYIFNYDKDDKVNKINPLDVITIYETKDDKIEEKNKNI